MLDMQFNNIRSISKKCFLKVKLVLSIVANNNNISAVFGSAFQNLVHLKLVNLSRNPLHEMASDAFVNLPHLKLFSIVNSCSDCLKILQNLASLQFEYLETDQYSFCCQTENFAQCSIETPWFVSCSDLLINDGIKIVSYVLSSIILVVNIASIILHTVSFHRHSEKSQANNVLVISINVADAVSSIPLFILWISDLVYKGVYIQYEYSWKSSLTCHIVSTLFLFFNLLSPFVLCHLAFFRLSIVLYPVESKFKESLFVIKTVSISFGVFLFISIVCTIIEWSLNHFVLHSHIPLSVCSPFVDPQNAQAIIQVFTWGVVICQVVALEMIVVFYILLYKSLKESQEKVKESISREQSNILLIVQIIIVTSSNLLCWLPSGMIYLSSFFLDEYPIKMMVWTIVVVNTVNSVLNPVVFVFMICRKFIS